MQKNGYAEVGGARFTSRLPEKGLRSSWFMQELPMAGCGTNSFKCLQSITGCCGMTGVAWKDSHGCWSLFSSL